MNPERQTRRDFLKRSLTMPAALLVGPATAALAQSGGLRPTPACGDEGDITPIQTEGPYFKPDSPRRASLLQPGMPATRMVVAGLVLSTQCTPIPRALLDFWHADDRGEYDNVGFRLRGHLFTDDSGRYRLETIVPGLYPGRTRHFHVKVQAPVMKVEDQEGGKLGRFNFVLDDQLRRNRSRR